MADFVKICELVDKLSVEVVYHEEHSLQRKVTSSEISRPALELTGYFKHYVSDRLQLFGMKEISFLKLLQPDERLHVLREICLDDTPAMIVARDLEILPEMLQAAKDKHVPILRSPAATSRLLGHLASYLDDELAERISVHGVLIDINGLGVLIQGDSGIGKSETGLELVKRGHRLVADDRVDVYQKDELTVIGEPPTILRHLLEIRGVGIIDVMSLFGASSVLEKSAVNLAVYLEQWSKDKQYDRLGNDKTVLNIANVDVPQIRIPVKTGRNLSIIIEAAAMNFRARTMGFDATRTFEERLSSLIEENSVN